MRRAKKSARKSARKSAVGRPFEPGHDPRRGRGPRPGAQNAGRPPSAVRAACRDAFARRIPVLEAIADDSGSAPGDRLRALDLLGRYAGLLNAVLGEDDAGALERPGVVILPMQNKGLESRHVTEVLMKNLSSSPPSPVSAPPVRAREPNPRASTQARGARPEAAPATPEHPARRRLYAAIASRTSEREDEGYEL